MANRRPLYVPKQDRGPAEYTAGKEFMSEDGKEYIGLYHRIKNGQIWTEASFNKKSIKLMQYVSSVAGGTKASGTYFNLTGKLFHKHTVPVYYYPQPTKKDYNKAQFTRYFVAKKNDASTLVEINEKQYLKLNIRNKKGLNDDLYTQVQLNWSIAGPRESVVQFNKEARKKASKEIPTIKTYLGDLSEYYKG
tara:strand:- start:3598 stop:4173 length:576 start_codon:yes stop_codon:yes gene_type:complete